MTDLVTGQDRTELLQALAKQLEPSLPELRANLRTSEDVAQAVAGVLDQGVRQIEQLLQDDGRADDVQRQGFWPVWDAIMADRGRVARGDEHWLPEVRIHLRGADGAPMLSETAQMIASAVEAGVKAAREGTSEVVVEQTGEDGKVKTTKVRTTRVSTT